MNDEEFKKIYGWDNRETHQVAIYLQNNLYFVLEDLRKESKNWMELSDKIRELFDEMKDNILDNPNDEDCIQMLFGIGSLSRVNWDQIAKSFY